jgi:sec-independent protein translocase protein TatA
MDMANNILAMFGLPGGTEWIVILVIALLLFGRRLPEIARGMGKSITEFKKGLHEAKDEFDKAADLEETKKEIQDAADSLRDEIKD